MGATQTHTKPDKLHSAVFDGILPIKPGDSQQMPRQDFCPDCHHAFSDVLWCFHCGVCGEALCGLCCPPRRCWKRRTVCHYCVDILVAAYNDKAASAGVVVADGQTHNTKIYVEKRQALPKGVRRLFMGVDVSEVIMKKN